MATWVLLLVVGVILICAAYFLDMLPPPIKNIFMFGGAVCLILGIVLLILSVLGMGGLAAASVLV